MQQCEHTSHPPVRPRRLEQHIRRNKLRMGVTLSDQLRAAAEDGEAVKEVTSKTEAKRLAFYIHMNVLGLSDLRGRKWEI